MLIWGTRWSSTPLGQISYNCSQCGKQTVHTAYIRKGKFTLFFIPIFPISKQYLIACNLCGLRLKAVDNLLAQLENLEKTGNLSGTKEMAGSA